MPRKLHEHVQKTAVGYIVDTNIAEGVVKAIVNVFGIVDTQTDIIHPGAYSKTLKERGNQIRVKILDNHQTHSVTNIVAKALDIHEVNRAQLPEEVRTAWPEATGGLYAEMQFMLDDPGSLAVFKRIDFGASNEYSIGLDIIEADYSQQKMDDGRTMRVRNIRQLALFDVSPVIWGANEGTVTTQVKSVTKYEDLPLATRGRLWEADAADQRVRTWAGVEDAPNTKYQKAFFWHNDDAADAFASYKLGFADIIDGVLTAIPRGIMAVAGALDGARGGVDIPDADQTAVKAQVGKYYEKMAREFDDDSIVVPWIVEDVEGKDMGSTSGATGGVLEPNESPVTQAGKRQEAVRAKQKKIAGAKQATKNDEAQTLGSWFMGAMLMMTNDCAEDLLSDACIDLAGYKSISDALMAGLQAFEAALPPEIAMMAYPHDDYSDWWAWFGRETPDVKAAGAAAPAGAVDPTVKEGRKLSTTTKEKLNGIHTKANGAMQELRDLIDETDLQDSAFENADLESEGKSKAEPDTRPLTFDAAATSKRLAELGSISYTN